MTDKIKELKLIPSNDPRILSSRYPFNDDMLKEHDFKASVPEFSVSMAQ